MKITRKTSVAAALALTLPLALGACAKTGGGNSGTSNGKIVMWTHNAGNKAELASIKAIVKDFNASQKKYQVKVQAFPQDSYNQSVVAAAASKKLPCLLDIDGPNVPNWAWAGYLAPLTGMDSTLAAYLPSTVGKYNGKYYSYGYYDVALNIATRKSILARYGIRVPTVDNPWTKDEFDAALAKIKAGGQYKVVFDMGTQNTGEWWPYAYSPMLQSFGGDLINRTDYKSAAGALNGSKAVEWATWFRSMVTKGYSPLKSSTDPTQDFINGKVAMIYNGSWAAPQMSKKFGSDMVYAAPPNFGAGSRIGGASWQWGMSKTCGNSAGAMAYLKFASADKYVASVSTATNNIPATDAAAAQVAYFKPGGEGDVFRQISKKYALVRPVTPGYPFISTEFTKTAQDILAGADPQKALDKAVKDIDANQKSNNYFK